MVKLSRNSHMLASARRLFPSALRAPPRATGSFILAPARPLSGPASTPPIATAEVLEAQAAWAASIKRISAVHAEDGDYVAAAAEAAGALYGYGHGSVLFKPTKAAEHPFRPTANEAMSYFVGGSAVPGGYAEDGGFAINGGKGWSEVQFANHQIDIHGPVAVAMGEYHFTCRTSGEVAKVEYTFGYKRVECGGLRIFLHHSSVPFTA